MTDEEFDYVTGVPDNLGPEVSALGLLPPWSPLKVAKGAKPTDAFREYWPGMSLLERDRRWDRVRKQMYLSGVDALVLLGSDMFWDGGLANLRYLLGIGQKMGSAGLFFLDADPVLYNSVPHMSRPFHMTEALQDWTTDVRVGGGIPLLAAELKDRGYGRATIGVVSFSSTLQPPTLLAVENEALKASLPHARVVDFTSRLQELRMVKSEEEIGLLRQAGKIARKAVDAMVEAAVPGRTEADVYSAMLHAQISNGAEPDIFNLFASGPVEHPPTELWHLQHGTDQPSAPTQRPLSEGDIINSEWHTRFGGYMVHTEYSVYLGAKPPRELERIWNVSVECLDASREALVPGRTIREAIEMIRKPCKDAGLDFIELGFHAMGLASPEFPTVVFRDGIGTNTANGHKIGELVLEEGMAFGNNIDLFDPSWKPDVGCMLADFMVVRAGGAELLVDTPRTIGLGR